MSAGASGTICTNPLWVVKTRFMVSRLLHPDEKLGSHSRLQTQDVASGEPRYRNTWDALRRIYVAEGIAAFYRGMVPSLLGVSHVAVQFPLYEQFKNLYRASQESHQLFDASHMSRTGPADGSDISASTILVCSASSKMIASVATYPHEVLRTRMQLGKQHAGEVAARGHRVELALEGLMDTSRRIWAEAGLVGFYRGLSINLVRTIPNSALTILTYASSVAR